VLDDEDTSARDIALFDLREERRERPAFLQVSPAVGGSPAVQIGAGRIQLDVGMPLAPIGAGLGLAPYAVAVALFGGAVTQVAVADPHGRALYPGEETIG